VFDYLGEVNKVQSSIPSCMKCVSILDVKTNNSLKVKRHTVVITIFEASSNSKEKIKEEEQASSKHVKVRETDKLEAKVKPAEALKNRKGS